ncbi:hypothetical protein FGO68_gene14465 [Halteria grandinella]|uniref:Uncharacterized protein n=1 Tax=Halteria grandinella TaxID=5974 RepID=A0A8J8NVC3_HALGN|nr:hypothetical protein FGO68_gene14465 [Halteria grandinella]
MKEKTRKNKQKENKLYDYIIIFFANKLNLPLIQYQYQKGVQSVCNNYEANIQQKVPAHRADDLLRITTLSGTALLIFKISQRKTNQFFQMSLVIQHLLVLSILQSTIAPICR